MSNLVKKVTASVAALSIVMSIVSPVVGVKADDASVAAANRLAALGVIVDNSSNPAKYNLDGSITRREMLKVMMNLSSVEVGTTCEGKFADLKSSDWGCKYAEAALKAGFIAANTNFRPNDLVSKSEALKMVMQAKGLAKKEGVTPWQKAYVEAWVEAGITTAFSDYTSVAKRSMVIVTADAASTTTSGDVADGSDDLDLGDIFGNGTTTGSSTGVTSTGTTTTTTGSVSTGTTVVGNGDLELSLNPASPASGTQIPNVGTVRFAKVDFTAASSDVSLNSVELKKSGLSTVDSDTKVWFEKAWKRVSGRAGFTSEGNVVVSFAPAYVVKAGSTETLDLYVELPSTAKTGIDYQFISGKVVATAKNVSGSFVTPTLRSADYAVAKAEFSQAGTSGNYKATSDSVELGAFKIYANDAAKTEQTDLTFQSVMLTASGSANLTNLTDIQLVRNDVKVSSDVVVDGKTLTFTVNDSIKEGTTATYYVKAKIANVEDSTDVYQFRLKNTTDLNVIEAKNGFRATVPAVDTLKYYTVTGGELKFERDTTVALSQNYAPGTSEVVLMQGTITAKNAVRLEDLSLTYSAKNSSSTTVALSDFFTTLNLVIGGTSYSASAPTLSGTTSVDFDGTANISGTVNVKLYATLKSNSVKGTVKFEEMKMEKFATREFVSNDETVSSGVGSIAWVNVTVEDSTLNVTRNDGLGSTNLAAGSKAVTLYGLSLTSTKGNPINVTSATFDFTGSSGSYTSNVYATLYVNGTAVASKTIDAATVKFDWFTTKVSKDSSVNMVLKADLSDSFSAWKLTTKLSALTAVDTANSDEIPSSAYSKPTGALFTIASANAEFALSDNNPKASLLEAGKVDNKLFAFKVTAKNDTIKLKDINLTGTGLSALSNFRLTNASNVVVASSSSADATNVKFTSIASDNTAIAMDKSSTFYVIADTNSNTNTGSVQLALNSAVITGSNGLDNTTPTLVWTIASKDHAIAENVLVVAKAANSNKSLSTSAMVFTVTASGKDSVTLSGFTFAQLPTGYTATGTVRVYKDSVSAANEVTSSANNTVDAGSTVTFIAVVDGATKNGSANTISYELQLTDLATSTISSVVKYLNVGSFPFVETINN